METDATNADGLTNLKALVGDANLGNVGLVLGTANVDVNSVVGDNLGFSSLVLTGQGATADWDKFHNKHVFVEKNGELTLLKACAIATAIGTASGIATAP